MVKTAAARNTNLRTRPGRRELNDRRIFGRQYEITPAIRDEIESGLANSLRSWAKHKSKVILTVEKHRNIAEITV